jgi:hypothetical protein
MRKIDDRRERYRGYSLAMTINALRRHGLPTEHPESAKRVPSTARFQQGG